MTSHRKQTPTPLPHSRFNGAPDRAKEKLAGVPEKVQRMLHGYKNKLTTRAFEKELRQKLGLFRPK